MTFGNRLKQLRENKGLTQEELGNHLNLTKANISKYELGKLEPNFETLKFLATFFNVTTDFLLGRPSPDVTLIPILGTIRAGIPLLAEENWESQVEVPADIDADFALKVVGDSMSWVGVCEGDMAILCQTDIAEHGDIIAAGLQDDEWTATLKFFIKENGTPVLRAANPDYKDIPINSNHKIIGKLVCIQKQPPSLYTYRDFLVKKEIVNTGWQDAVELAISHGLDSKQMKNMIELFSHMIKQVK